MTEREKAMQGTRVECPFAANGTLLSEWPKPGEYWHRSDNAAGWQAVTPNGHMAALARHTVTEHEDGTISVSPSILVRDTQNASLWHGYLTLGVWREC